MPCPEMLDRICAELREDIESEVCRELKEHLAECPDCRAYVDSLKKTVILFRSVPDKNIPEDVQGRLFKSLKID